MFEYSCTSSRLVNWILSQVDIKHDVVFPKQKNWDFYLRLFYPGDSPSSLFLVGVFDQRECILFIPVNHSTKTEHLKYIDSHLFKKAFRDELGFDGSYFQRIFITCEKDAQEVEKRLLGLNSKADLLVMMLDKLEFRKGGFKNPRLEYRLSKRGFDPEIIPRILTDNQIGIGQDMTKSQFYQTLFHNLNRIWMQGESSVSLRELLKQSIPYWTQYRKSEHKKLFNRIKEELVFVFHEFFKEKLKIEEYCKKANSQPKTIILLPQKPIGKKELNQWVLMQKQSLVYLRDDIKPIAFDLMKLPSP